MMFSKLGRSISRLSRSRNVLSGGNGVRSLIFSDCSLYQCRYGIREADDDKKVGVISKRYLGSLAANNQRIGSGLSSKVYKSDINYIFQNPRNRSFFSSPKKKKELSTEHKGGFFPLIIYVPLLLIGLKLCSWLLYKLLCKEVDKLLIICDILGEESATKETNMNMEAEEEKEG